MPEEDKTRVGYEFETQWMFPKKLDKKNCMAFYELYQKEGGGRVATCHARIGNEKTWVEVLSGEYDEFYTYNQLRYERGENLNIEQYLKPTECKISAMEFVTRGDGIFPFEKRGDSLLYTTICLNLFKDAFSEHLEEHENKKGYVVISRGNHESLEYEIRMQLDIFKFLTSIQASIGTTRKLDYSQMHVTHSLPLESFCTRLSPIQKKFLLNDNDAEHIATTKDLLQYYSVAEIRDISTSARGTLRTNIKSPLDIVSPLLGQGGVDEWDLKQWCEKKADLIFKKFTMTSTEDTSHIWVVGNNMPFSRPKALFICDWFRFLDSLEKQDKLSESDMDTLLPGIGAHPTMLYKASVDDGRFSLADNPTSNVGHLCSHPITTHFEGYILFHLSSDENLQPVFKVVTKEGVTLDFRVLIEHRAKDDTLVKIYSKGLELRHEKQKTSTEVTADETNYLEIFKALDAYDHALEEKIDDDRSEDSDSARYDGDNLVESALQPNME